MAQADETSSFNLRVSRLWALPREIETHLPVAVLVVVVALGAFLRFYRLGARSLWLDEILWSHTGTFKSALEAIQWTQFLVQQMPLYAVLTWALHPFGGSDIVLRLPSAMAGALTVLAMYYLGRELFGQWFGIAVAALMAVMPFNVWYSQENGVYSLLMLFTTTQAVFVYRAARCKGWVDWAGLTLATILNIYTHYVALIATFTFALFLFTVFVAGGVPRGRMLVRAAISGLVVLAAYAPWFHWLLVFLRAPAGPAMFNHRQATSIDVVLARIGSFGFSGLLLGLLLIGLLTATAWLFRGRFRQSALLLEWFVIPVVAMALKLGGTAVEVQPRYLSFLFPAAVILTIVGGFGTYGAIRAAIGSWVSPQQSKFVGGVIGAVLLGAIVVQSVPALADSYRRPKDDWRGVRDYLSQASSPGSVVIATGFYADFVDISLGHYLDQHHSPAIIEDGRRVDSRALDRLQSGNGKVWAVIFQMTAEERQRFAYAHLTVRDFSGVSVIDTRSDPAISPLAAALQLLQLEEPAERGLDTSLMYLDTVDGSTQLSANILPNPSAGAPAASDGWSLAADTSLSGDRIVLSPRGEQANATLTTRSFESGAYYLMSFSCRNQGFKGSQKVFVSSNSTAGEWLTIAPTGEGFDCGVANDWSSYSFAFQLPPGTASVTIWLRAEGHGVAEFGNITLQKLTS